MDPSICNATALRKASRRVSALYDEALQESGLKSTQFAILAELERQAEPPTMRRLAEALVMDRSSLGHNLRPLQRDGLVALESGERDRRRRHVVLTKAGARAFAQGRVLWAAAQERFEALHGNEAAAALRATLLAIAADERLSRLRD